MTEKRMYTTQQACCSNYIGFIFAFENIVVLIQLSRYL